MLKYGIVLSAGHLRAWHLRCIERLHHSKLARLECVLSDASQLPPVRRAALYGAASSQQPAEIDDIRKIVPSADSFDVRLSRPDELPAVLDSVKVDFFLLIGDSVSGAPLEKHAPYGVWYFAPYDATRFSTSAPGFWEIHGDHDVSGAFLLQLRTDGTAGVPLKSAYLPTMRQSFEENVDSIFEALAQLPQHVCWDITHGAAGYFSRRPLEAAPRHLSNPTPFQITAMRMRERRNRAAAYVRTNFYSIEWALARVRETPANFIGTDRRANVSYLYRADKARYFADPCVVTHQARPYLFFEDYHYKTDVGAVSVCELDDNRASAPQPAIEEAHHLSYPHVFEYDGETYCIPESGRIRKVRLYRCVEFPKKWEFVHTLIDGFEAADSTIVRYGDRWWLFCTSSEGARKGLYSHLYVWHSQELFGNWVPHVSNPVKIDARSARPAGPFFVHEGALYRPAQDCSRSYGGAVRINRVDKLSLTEFQETVVGTIRPPRSRYSRGLHTLSAGGDWCIVDVERYAFSPLGARYACTQAIQRALARMRVPEDAMAWIRRKVKTASKPAHIQTAQSTPSEVVETR